MKLHCIVLKLTVLSAAALTLATLVLPAAHAAPPSSGLPVFGSVDINRIQAKSDKKAKYDTELHALAAKLDLQFKQQATNIMLTKTEQLEMGGLMEKVNQSDSDKARITALQTQASKSFQELSDLQQKKDPTPADTNHLAALTTQYTTGQAALQEVGDSYQARLKVVSDKDNADFTQSVKAAIAEVAQQRGLSVVFTSDIAVYTTNDITDDVVKRINR